MKQIAALITRVIREGEGCLPEVKREVLAICASIRCMPTAFAIKIDERRRVRNACVAQTYKRLRKIARVSKTSKRFADFGGRKGRHCPFLTY